MNTIEISSLPQLLFSHVYRAQQYKNSFPVREQHLEVSYLAEGELCITVGDETFRAKKGDVVCFLQDAPTSVLAESVHCHHTVGFTVDWRRSDQEQSSLLLPTVLPSESNPANICRGIDDIIHNHILYMTSKAQGAAKILELLCGIDTCARKLQTQHLSGEMLYVRRAKQFIQQNIHAAIQQKDIAEHLGISPEYLCAVFKKTEGTTVMRYINKIKLDNIKGLLDHTSIRLYDAAAMYGYSDPNYVSRLYKQMFGYNITDKPLIQPEIEIK